MYFLCAYSKQSKPVAGKGLNGNEARHEQRMVIVQTVSYTSRGQQLGCVFGAAVCKLRKRSATLFL